MKSARYHDELKNQSTFIVFSKLNNSYIICYTVKIELILK